MWSGHVHRVYAPRRTIAAENKLDAYQESAAYPAELDSGLGDRFGIVTRNRLVSGASGFS